jgi:signal transduction histidine kinase
MSVARDRGMPLLRGVVPLAVGFVLLTGVVAVTAWFVSRQESANKWVQHTLEVRERLARILSVLQDAETGQRGYLLTADESYLDPFKRAMAEYDSDIEKLGAAIADNETQKQAVSSLRTVAEDRIAVLQKGINVMRTGDRAGAREIVLTGQGTDLMNRTRAILERMGAEESRLLIERRNEAERAARALQAGTAGAIILVLLLSIFVVTEMRQRIRLVIAARDSIQQANTRLVEAAAKQERLETQLRQSQKMDAIGQLTGGLAHDFNNMLAVIIGSLHLLKRRMARGEIEDADRFLENALDGAQRAATLTSRLLAFARQQALSPEPIDPNKFVAGMADLLRRTIGENIQLETVLAGGLWRTHADASQLENVLLNLCINARDAMPDGGKLTIETVNAHLDEAYATDHADVPPGQYVLLAVTDTGVGMPKPVIEKAFDPFFTTKGDGKGTGLGLSQVFGFVKQTGGHIKIYSEVGRGTTIKIYLPRFLSTDDIDRAVSDLPPMNISDLRGTAAELVLVVEDEERLRHIVVEALRELGYTVLQADSAASGLRTLDSNPEVTLLFTDIVMPDVNGRTLADEAQRRHPNLKVLFMTGYTRNAVVHNGLLDSGVHLLSKPFTIEQLAAKVRSILGPSSV